MGVPDRAFELENARRRHGRLLAVEGSCVRATLRVVFCYRRDSRQGSALIGHLAEGVVQAMGIDGRNSIAGERSSSSGLAAIKTRSLTASSRTGRSTPKRAVLAS